MIEVAHLQKRFAGVQALSDVSFRAPAGAITGLLGHNGAGKTTTLRILYGLLRADAGTATVEGLPVQEARREVQARIGVMTDAHGLYPRLTAREHIAYFAALRGLSRARTQARCAQLLEQLNMGDIADRRAEGFSQGEKMKVCLARSLVHDPQTIIMDEPTNGLDVLTTRTVRSLLTDLKGQGKCVLLSSHIMQEIAALCDEVVVMGAGRVMFQGDLAALQRFSGESELEDAFVSLTRSL